MLRKQTALIPSLLILGAVLFLLSSCGGGRAAKVEPRAPVPPPPGPPPPLLASRDLVAVTEDLRTLIPSLMKQARIPGLQIALIRDGSLAWHGSFGVRDANTRSSVGDETIFEAASLTKPFFAYYVMKLVEQRRLDLDQPVFGYLPAEEVVKFIGHPLDEKDFRRDWLEKATARQILSHSAGFPHGETGRPYPLLFEPGTKWKYSSAGYLFLQRAIEHLEGAPLEQLMQKEVLDPLGMTRSSMVWKPDYEAAMAAGHGLLGRPEAFRKRTAAHAAATLYTTAEDYAKFLCAVLNGEGIAAEELRTMIAPQIDKDKPLGLGWSLGFGTQADENGPALWQWGDYGIFRNYVIVYPESRCGVVYLTNSFFGLGVCQDLVAHSVGGRAMGSLSLDYLPYDSPLYKFVRHLEERGPIAVAELKALKKARPDLADRKWIGYVADCFMEENILPHALALYDYVLKENPRSGSAALAAAEAHLKMNDPRQARRRYERALKASKDPVDKAYVKWRLDYIVALDKPAPADITGEWAGILWTGDGATDALTMVLKSAGGSGGDAAIYEGTIGDAQELIPKGTQLQRGARSGDQFTFGIDIPLEGGKRVEAALTLKGETMKGRWTVAADGTNGAVEFVRKGAR